MSLSVAVALESYTQLIQLAVDMNHQEAYNHLNYITKNKNVKYALYLYLF